MNCKVCEQSATSSFNIGFTEVAICNKCAGAITLQYVHWLIRSIKHAQSHVEQAAEEFVKDLPKCGQMSNIGRDGLD